VLDFGARDARRAGRGRGDDPGTAVAGPAAAGAAIAGTAISGAAGDARTRARAQDVTGGTPGYMSPEQILGLPVDSGTDIWAFACILYECIAGRPAFAGKDWRDRNARRSVPGPTSRLCPPRRRADPGTPRPVIERERERRLDSITKRAGRSRGDCIPLPPGARRGRRMRRTPLETIPNNIPASLTSFVGREAVLGRMQALLGENRSLTVTGSAIRKDTTRDRGSPGPSRVPSRTASGFVDLLRRRRRT